MGVSPVIDIRVIWTSVMISGSFGRAFNHNTQNIGLSNIIVNSIVSVNKGMREYFNLMLGAQLLYKFERPQYAQMKKNHEASATDGDDMGLSSIYGSIHLLRLFVKVNLKKFKISTYELKESIGYSSLLPISFWSPTETRPTPISRVRDLQIDLE